MEKKFEITYDLTRADEHILKCLNRKSQLTTIQRELREKYPFFDEQIILSHILNVAKNNNFYFNNHQIRRCFNKFYDKEQHGSKKDYLSLLYTPCPSKNSLSGVINRAKKPQDEAKNEKDDKIYIQEKIEGSKEVFNE